MRRRARRPAATTRGTAGRRCAGATRCHGLAASPSAAPKPAPVPRPRSRAAAASCRSPPARRSSPRCTAPRWPRSASSAPAVSGATDGPVSGACRPPGRSPAKASTDAAACPSVAGKCRRATRLACPRARRRTAPRRIRRRRRDAGPRGDPARRQAARLPGGDTRAEMRDGQRFAAAPGEHAIRHRRASNPASRQRVQLMRHVPPSTALAAPATRQRTAGPSARRRPARCRAPRSALLAYSAVASAMPPLNTKKPHQTWVTRACRQRRAAASPVRAVAPGAR